MNDSQKSLKDFSLKSLRTFVGAKNYKISKEFYAQLEFQIINIDTKMCFIRVADALGFYLQDAYVKDWVNNTMLFLEVEELDEFYHWILAKELPQKFENVRFTKIRNETWGREFFMHDPSGILWHFGNFKEY